MVHNSICDYVVSILEKKYSSLACLLKENSKIKTELFYTLKPEGILKSWHSEIMSIFSNGP